MAKINISINDELLKRVDDYASKTYISRSGLIAFACNQYLNSHELILALKSISLSMKKIADNGTVDEESLNEIRDFERLVGMLDFKKIEQ